jgi:ketosteroid isomerase-like protein
MTAIAPVTWHGAEYLRLLDAKDEPGILALMTEDAQIVDEITRRWYRGKHEIGLALREIFSRLSDVHSTAEDMHSVRWGDTEVETFLLHQAYDLDGATCSVISPTCLLWRRTTEGWKLALMESIPTTVT